MGSREGSRRHSSRLHKSSIVNLWRRTTARSTPGQVAGAERIGARSGAVHERRASGAGPAEVRYVLVDYGDHDGRRDDGGLGRPVDERHSESTPWLSTSSVPTWGSGWTLVALHAEQWSWSMPLAARGAAPLAPSRVAQAVAVRVLGEHGVAVEGWTGGAGGGRPMFRALLSSR